MRVFISCSKDENVLKKYKDLAIEVSTFLAKRGHKLVFGGCDTGMMGKCFYTFKYENGKTKGIADISNAEMLNTLEVDASQVTPSIFERTKSLYTSSEMLLILPGGVETYGEIFSILDEVKTKNINYPIVLFNFDNFYTSLLDFIKKSYDEGFISSNDIKRVNIVTNLKSLENFMNEINRKEEN